MRVLREDDEGRQVHQHHSPCRIYMWQKLASQPCATQSRPRSDLARTAPGATSRPRPGGNHIPPSDTRHPALCRTDPAARAPSARGWGMSHASRDRLSARLFSQGPQMRRECRSRARFGAFCSVATLVALALLPQYDRNWPYWGYFGHGHGGISHFLISDVPRYTESSYFRFVSTSFYSSLRGYLAGTPVGSLSVSKTST